MLASLLLLVASAHASCDTRFEFVGQPACVDLAFDGSATQLRNDCAHPLLLDQSVVLGPRVDAVGAQVPAQSSAAIRDLSAFTLGMNGDLYLVVAAVAPVPATCGATLSAGR